MKNLRTSMMCFAAVLVGLFLFAGFAEAQEGQLPLPSGIGTSGQLLEIQSDGQAAGTSTPSVTSVTVGSGTAITKIQVLSAAITPTWWTYAARLGLCNEQSFTVTGLSSADKVMVNLAYAMPASVSMVSARASTGANTILITFCNQTTATVTPTGGTINVLAIRS